MAARNYSNVVPPAVLQITVNTVATTLTVASTAGYPTVPFTLALDRGNAAEELCLCTAKDATTFTVTRGYDSTTASAHTGGLSVIEHTVASIDYREANALASALTTSGDLLYLNSSLAPTRMAIGTLSQILRVGASSVPGWADLVIWVGHTWTVSVPGVPSGATSFICPKRIRVPSGMTAKLYRADSGIRAGTSVTWDARKASTIAAVTAGTTLTGFTSQSAVPAGATVAPTALALTDGDYIAPVISVVSGSPDNFTVDFLIGYTFAG